MASFTSGYQRTPGGWDWPSDLPGDSSHAHNARTPSPSPKQRSPQAADPAKPKKKRTWGPRVCRICLETVLPTFHEPSEHLPDLLQGAPRVSYDSDGGRLLRPCKCKGSAAYVHETCLQEWRYADPSYGKRNYWNCPTCGFQYRLGRMSWAHWVSSTGWLISFESDLEHELTLSCSNADSSDNSHLCCSGLRAGLCCRPNHQYVPRPGVNHSLIAFALRTKSFRTRSVRGGR